MHVGIRQIFITEMFKKELSLSDQQRPELQCAISKSRVLVMHHGQM